MDRAAFYAAVRASRLFGSSLAQRQVDGIEYIFDAAEHRGTPLQFLAYMLATAWHETARTMQPIEEYGHGHGRQYGRPVGPYGKIYFGRGFVQLTWLSNYERAAAELGVDLVRFPEKALELGNATLILFASMELGWFTGKKLADYIGPNGADYVNARRIVNGTDLAEKIAGYARGFEAALRKANYGQVEQPSPAPEPVHAQEPPAVPPLDTFPPLTPAPVPAAKAGMFALLISLVASLFGRKA
jgi:hypothetical protein